MDKKSSRLRRGLKTRAKIRELAVVRLSVHRTPRHIYAQIISADGSCVLAQSSSLDKELRVTLANGGNINAAIAVGKAIAEKSKAAGIDTVAFDRSGFRYHGRIKALADAAREAGLQF